MKKCILFCLFLFPVFLLAQETERVLVSGQIKAPPGEDVEGISVYNTSSQKGTVSDVAGTFTIEAGVNDRIVFTALQFQQFTVIVDEGIVENQKMNIVVNPSVTELDEVILRPYDLSGNIRADVNRIRVVDFNTTYDLSYEALEYEYEFSPDKQTSISNNVAAEALGYDARREGANLFGLVGVLVHTVFKGNELNLLESKKERQKPGQVEVAALEGKVLKRYFTEHLKIPEDQIVDFLYFSTEKDFNPELLENDNELKLLDFLYKKSKAYRAIKEEG